MDSNSYSSISEKKLEEFIIKYKNIKIIGGCCGTTPEHIAELRKTLDKH